MPTSPGRSPSANHHRSVRENLSLALSSVLSSSSPVVSSPTVNHLDHTPNYDKDGNYVPRARTVSEIEITRKRFETSDYAEISKLVNTAKVTKAELEIARKDHEDDMDKLSNLPSWHSFKRSSVQSNISDDTTTDTLVYDATGNPNSRIYKSLTVDTNTEADGGGGKRRSPRTTKQFLEEFYERQKNSPYSRPSVRMEIAKSLDETSNHDDPNSTSEKDASQSPTKAKVSFGIHDALDLKTLRELRKVFFMPEDEDDDGGGGSGGEEEDKKRDDEGEGEKKGAGEDAANEDEGVVEEESPDNNTPPRDNTSSNNDKDDKDDEMDNWESRDLDLDEFIAEFGHIIGPNLSRLELQTMFMKIDADSNGGVDWDEFTNWMLKMEAGSHAMTDEQELGELVPIIAQHGENPTFHRGMINKILPVKLPSQPTYVTAARDGTIRFWNTQTLENVKTVNVLESNLHYTKIHQYRKSMPGAKSLLASAGSTPSRAKRLWVTDVVMMSLSNRLAVASADRSISFYDTYTMEVACRVRNLPNIPTTLAYKLNASETAQFLIYGDDSGYIHVFKIKKDFNFDEGIDEEGNQIFEYWKGKSATLERQGLHYYYTQQIHTEWITSVVHIGAIQPSILTCSLDGNVKFFNVEKRNDERTFTGHKNGVHTIVYVRSTKSMASAGVGREILMWNPHTCTVMQTLIGHAAPVTHLATDERHSQLISMSMDKTFKFWDTSTWRCTSTIVDTANYRPDNYLTAFLWDPDLEQLISAGNRIKMWHHKKKEGKEDTCSHEASVCAALYNKNFQQVVSGDNASVVKVWSIETGQCVFRFDKLHGESKITTMSFDWSMRRLITGAHDGSVKVWNFSNGQQLKELIRDAESDGENESDDESEEGVDDDDSRADREHMHKTGSIYWGPTTKWGKEKWRKTQASATLNTGSLRPQRKEAELVDDAAAKLAKKIESKNDTEVTAVKYVLERGGGNEIEHKYIVSCGWDRKIRLFVDDEEDEVTPQRIFPAPGFEGHMDDILCIAHCEPRLIATGSFDGEIVIWSLASGSARFFLRLDDYDEEEKPKKLSLRTSPIAENRKLSQAAAEAPVSPSPSAPKFRSFRRSREGVNFGQRNIVDPLSPAAAPLMEPNETEKEDGENAIECLLFLKGKRVGEALGQTLVSAGADGKLRFWNLKDGSLCHVLKACHPKGSSISCMTSDEPDNKYLFTGCTAGHVKVWTLKSLEKAARKRIHRRFSVVGSDMGGAGGEGTHKTWANAASAEINKRMSAGIMGKKSPKTEARRRSEMKSFPANFNRRGSSMGLGAAGEGAAPIRGRRTSMRRASLSESDFAMPKVYEIASWKAHTGALVSIEHVGEWGGREVVLTASTDCNVSIWSLKGAHIGIFGQTLNWSLTNPSMWLDRKEYVVDKPKGNYGRGGGVLDDGDGARNLFKGRGGSRGGEKKKRIKGKLRELDAMLKQMDTDSSDEDGSSSDLDPLDQDSEVDLFEEERKAYEKKRKKLNIKYERMIADSEKVLEGYHYELAKARLEKKVMLFEAQRRGGKGHDSPIVKEANWNKRWGIGLRSHVPQADHNAGTRTKVEVAANGMHEVMIRDRSTREGGEGEGGGGGVGKGRKKKGYERTMTDVQMRAMERMKILRSGYNQTAHQLGVHAVENVEDCRGAELVRKKDMNKGGKGKYEKLFG